MIEFMKLRLGIRIFSPFVWNKEELNSILKDSVFFLQDSYDDKVPISLRRIRGASIKKAGQVTLIASGYGIHLKNNSSTLIEFLELLKTGIDDGYRNSNQRISVITMHFDTELPISMFKIAEKMELTPEMPNLEKIMDCKLTNASVDLYGKPELSDWFHLTLKPVNGDAYRAASFRIATSKQTIDEMIDYLNKLPSIVDAITEDFKEV